MKYRVNLANNDMSIEGDRSFIFSVHLTRSIRLQSKVSVGIFHTAMREKQMNSEDELLEMTKALMVARGNLHKRQRHLQGWRAIRTRKTVLLGTSLYGYSDAGFVAQSQPERRMNNSNWLVT